MENLWSYRSYVCGSRCGCNRCNRIVKNKDCCSVQKEKFYPYGDLNPSRACGCNYNKAIPNIPCCHNSQNHYKRMWSGKY